MGEDEAVGAGGGGEDVQAGGVTFAEGLDGDLGRAEGCGRMGGATLDDGIGEGDGGAGGTVELGDVVGLGDGEVVAGVGESGSHLRGELVHDLDADGEVGAIEEGGVLAGGEVFHVLELVVPAGSADDDAGAGEEAGAKVGDDGFGRGEVDDGVEAGEEHGGKGGGVGVFPGVEDVDAVTALGGDVCYEFAGLALAEDEDAHLGLLSGSWGGVPPPSLSWLEVL